MPDRPPYRFLFSAGGTGGHIFPALAVANRIRKDYPDSEFLFIGAKNKLEMTKVPEAGFEIKGLNISGIERSSMIKNILWPFKLIGSMLSALSIIRKFKPHAAAGFGGFASGPAIYASSLLGVPCLIQEQNSFAGVTNRLLGGKVKTICTAYEGMERFFPQEKIHLLGNPVRQEIIDKNLTKEDARNHFGIPKDKPLVLAFGGSQGALGINNGIFANLDQISDSAFELIWQTGSGFFQKAREAVDRLAVANVHVFEFIGEMDAAYAASDLVVCRSGAISISELEVVGKPAVFVPLPTAAEDHQTKNAVALEEKGAARVVKNTEVSEKLLDVIEEVLGNQETQDSMARAIQSLAKPNATLRISEKVIELAA